MVAYEGCRHTLRICNTNCYSTQQLLRKHATVLRYTYTQCYVIRTLLVFLLISPRFDLTSSSEKLRYSCHKLVTFGLKTTTQDTTQLAPLIRFHETPGIASHNTSSFTQKAEGKNDVITSATCVICHLWTQRREHRHVVLAPQCPKGRVLPPASSSAI